MAFRSPAQMTKELLAASRRAHLENTLLPAPYIQAPWASLGFPSWLVTASLGRGAPAQAQAEALGSPVGPRHQSLSVSQSWGSPPAGASVRGPTPSPATPWGGDPDRPRSGLQQGSGSQWSPPESLLLPGLCRSGTPSPRLGCRESFIPLKGSWKIHSKGLGDGVGIRHGVGIRPSILHRVVARCVPRLIWKKPKPEGRRRRPLGTASPGGHQAQPGLRAGGSPGEPGPRQNQPSPSRYTVKSLHPRKAVSQMLKLRDVVQNTRLVSSELLKSSKPRKSLRNCHSREEPKETGPSNVMLCHG
ncbi:uncharacterized protein LOC115899608 [Rhinopithecus roxellana]|uniref:uncharacterized protein LOC115899608 n=1 Tax=Rhinopithecus roxellana TaxID=61622 RepID=UPI0012376380|nr:uncharacterized protein LOC115899608 [Rhinopithecus roxellana]